MRFAAIVSVAIAFAVASAAGVPRSDAPPSPFSTSNSTALRPRTRVFAGVTIPDTPLITKALAFARAHSPDVAYNHIYRSFLFGFIIGPKIPGLGHRDLEAQAIAAILHDLGLDPALSTDKRFEVDGANVAREFLRKEAPADWDQQRLQLVWDAIALHTTRSLAFFKEPEVVASAHGVWADLHGPDNTPGGLLTWDEYNAVVKELPRLKLGEVVTSSFVGMLQTKPEVTYDNIASWWGHKYADGYSETVLQQLDELEASIAKLDQLST